ncbi:MAG: adenylate/guanylate cyclase domain-containing protein [archaeon]
MGYKEVLDVIEVTDNIIDINPEIRKASEKVLGSLIKYVGAKGGGILIYDFLDEKLKILSKSGKLSKNIILSSFRSKKILNKKRELAVPIILQNKCLGVIYLYGKNFSKEDVNYISASEVILDGRFKHEAESQGLRHIFERYVGEKALNKILKDRDKKELEGKTHNCSILFADINNFTQFTNTRPAKEVVEFLNNYFSKMSEIAFEKNGTIDKFVGDSIMVIFGSPLTQKGHAKLAVETGKKMISKMKYIVKKHKIKGGGLSIGIASGRVVAGNIGSKKMMDYTVIGKKVNLASRLTYLAGKNQILVDDLTKNSTKGFKYAEIKKSEIKGFEKVKVFRVVG